MQIPVPTMPDPSPLPTPARPRWQPLRLGLVDIFHYDDEEIWLCDGNLLLRGNNGTGKSKVLALTLPFLLDGQLTPARVEPDGDPGKRMEWNLLLGGQYQERVGYCWLEFGRLIEGGAARNSDGDGEAEPGAEYCTLGCGLRAVTGRGAPERWFFITPQRIRRDLWLVDANARVLSRDRLLEALAERGELHTSAAQYRDRVDERLFRLGRHRYEALINLLIQLRQPQLSKRPDERALSAALTEALPPLDQAVLSDVADAFRSLEDERKTLDGLHEARASVGDFLVHYRRYCAVAARRRAETLRQAQSAHERLSGELRETEEALAAARRDQVREQSRQEFLDLKLQQGRTRLQTLREGPEMRDATRLKEAEDRASECAKATEAASRRLELLQRDLAGLEARMDAERRACAEGSERLTEALATWGRSAQSAGIALAHGRILGDLRLPDGGGRAVSGSDLVIRAATTRLADGVVRRREAVARLDGLNTALAEAQDREARDRERRDRAQVQLEHLEQHLALAAESVDHASQSLVAAIRRALGQNAELRLADPEDLLAELADWCRTLEGDNPARHRLQGTYNRCRDGLTAALSQAHRELEQARDEAAALEDERRRIAAGELAVPPTPYTRDPAWRAERPGAPLWKLIDFDPALDPGARAGLESALESSGLLDAWVLPRGELRDARTWDTLLDAATAARQPAPRGLDAVLAVAVDPADAAAARIDPGTVSAILAAIGWGEQPHPAWVAADGRWRLGPAHGAWGKDEPAYIGHAARESARRRRLAEIAAALEELGSRMGALGEGIAALEARRERLDREWRALPSDEGLRAAHQTHAELARRLAEQRDELARCTERLAQSRAAAEQARDRRDKAALDLDLPAAPAELAAVAQALVDYEREAAGFWPSLQRHWDRLAQLRGLAERHAELAERRAEQADDLARAQADRRQARETWHTLKETLGERVDRLQRRIREAEEEIADFERQRKSNESALVEAAARSSRLAERQVQLGAALAERERERRSAADGLAGFAAAGLLGIAVPGLEIPEREPPWPIDPTVRLARRVEQALSEVKHDDDAWRRQQQGLHDRFQPLQQTLSRYGHTASVEQEGELLLVRILFQARHCGPDALAASLDTEVAERKALLDAKERELLEEHLMSDAAGHLQQRIGDGERMVERINRELEQRPTSTGMRLRLAWVSLDETAGDAPAGLAEARKRLLRQTQAAWSEDDRRAVGEFLKRRIDAIRAGDDGGTLIEHLERALDYRHWHRFTVERWQGGRWRPAYGPASGGERALVVTLPLFAAASSHYGSAAPEAPRLVMLDEAFAGIDDDARAKCLGLMAQFDLDFVLTSEREWGCYAEVPGLAIAQLVRHEGIDAVYLSRWTWDGHRRLREPAPPMPPPPQAKPEPEPEPALSLEESD